MPKKTKAKKKVAPKAKVTKKAVKMAVKAGLQPLGDRIVVRPLTDEETGTRSPSGIIIPDTVSKENPSRVLWSQLAPDDTKRESVLRCLLLWATVYCSQIWF